MALFDLADPTIPLPAQLVLDTSLLLACRAGDDNPHAPAAQQFVRRLGQRIADYQMIGWLLIPVLQECYHIILSRSLRHVWEALPPQDRRPNWLVTYKHQPELLAAGFADMAKFDDILAAIPLTLARPEDLTSSPDHSLDERIRYFITTYYLLPQDALILAEAERLGVTAVATLDHDWRRVAEFDIYTTPV
jgi:predicted nucleic acid-binding protein